MFETINDWIVTYIETPYYQRTIECDCLFWLAIVIYVALAAAAIFIIRFGFEWLIATRFKKFVDKAVEKEARYKKERQFEKQEPTQEAETEEKE